MKLGITIWGNWVSPVFEQAQILLLVEISENRVQEISREQIVQPGAREILKQLRTYRVPLVICGAISEHSYRLLKNSGIATLPFVSGRYIEILYDFAANKKLASHSMPGCRGKNRCRRKRNLT